MRLTRAASRVGFAGLLVIVGAVAAVAAFGDRLLAAAVERAGPALLEREVRVGNVAIDWGRHVTIRATDLALADAAWSANPAMLSIRRAELTFDLLHLLRLRLSPVALGLHRPALHLVRNARGDWNLPEIEGGGPDGGVRASLSTIRELGIEGGEITLDDLASSGVEAQITALSTSLSRGAERVGFSGTVSHDGGEPAAFSGWAGTPAMLLGSDSRPFPVRLTIGPDTARISVEGHVARPLDLAGVDLRVQAQGEDLAPLLAAFAGGAAVTPPFRLTARLADTARGWRVTDLAARMGESEARGEAALSFTGQARPQLRLHLVAPQLVPADLAWLTSLGRAREDASGPVADARLQTAWLHRADAQGSLRVERMAALASGPAALRLDFTLDKGRLHVEPLRLELAEGMVEGAATIESSDGAPPRIALRVDANGLELGPLLAMFGTDGTTGTLATASADLRGQGTTLREVAAGLDGGFRFRMTDGSIGLSSLSHMSMGLLEAIGVALGGPGRGSTPVTCAMGDVPVRHGLARAE